MHGRNSPCVSRYCSLGARAVCKKQTVACCLFYAVPSKLRVRGSHSSNPGDKAQGFGIVAGKGIVHDGSAGAGEDKFLDFSMGFVERI